MVEVDIQRSLDAAAPLLHILAGEALAEGAIAVDDGRIGRPLGRRVETQRALRDRCRAAVRAGIGIGGGQHALSQRRPQREGTDLDAERCVRRVVRPRAAALDRAGALGAGVERLAIGQIDGSRAQVTVDLGFRSGCRRGRRRAWPARGIAPRRRAVVLPVVPRGRRIVAVALSGRVGAGGIGRGCPCRSAGLAPVGRQGLVGEGVRRSGCCRTVGAAIVGGQRVAGGVDIAGGIGGCRVEVLGQGAAARWPVGRFGDAGRRCCRRGRAVERLVLRDARLVGGGQGTRLGLRRERVVDGAAQVELLGKGGLHQKQWQSRRRQQQSAGGRPFLAALVRLGPRHRHHTFVAHPRAMLTEP